MMWSFNVLQEYFLTIGMGKSIYFRYEAFDYLKYLKKEKDIVVGKKIDIIATQKAMWN